MKYLITYIILFFSHSIFASSLNEFKDSPLVIYDKEAFEGKYMGINEDLSKLEKMNDKMKSFIIQPGYVVKFYENENFKGKEYIRTSRSEDGFYPEDFANKISSIKIMLDDVIPGMKKNNSKSAILDPERNWACSENKVDSES